MSAPAHPAALAANTWHLAGSLVSLKAAIDRQWPKRDKASDGGIGNEAHQKLGNKSDHNPWLNNTVRAYDFDVDGINAPWLAEQLRLAGLAGDPRLAGKSGRTDDNGYVIYNRHITSPDFTRWVPYDGSNPHTLHVHVSVTRDPAGYEFSGPWSFLEHAPLHPPATQPAPAPAPAPAPPANGYGPTPGNSAAQAPAPDDDPVVVEPNYPPPGADAIGNGDDFRAQFGNRGPKVLALQGGMNDVFPAYSGLIEDGDYGPNTAAVIEEFARRAADDPACPPGDREGLRAADGNNVGPRLARALVRYGVRV